MSPVIFIILIFELCAQGFTYLIIHHFIFYYYCILHDVDVSYIILRILSDFFLSETSFFKVLC